MDYEAFKKQVFILTGINLSAYKENQMKRRIDALIKKNSSEDYGKYIAYLKKSPKALEDFKAYLTINVTEFFRNPLQWDVLEKQILSLLLEKKRPLKIWSAACSTGDEPYSLAMVMSRFVPLHEIEILATDLDEKVLKIAQEGFYTSRHLVNLPAFLKQKYFKKENDGYRINNEIKRCITFKQHNLLKDAYPVGIDLIICRNVLIYFTEDAKKEIYHQFNKSLVDEGILFVGSTEQIIMCQKYGFESNKIFFYQKCKENKTKAIKV